MNLVRHRLQFIAAFSVLAASTTSAVAAAEEWTPFDGGPDTSCADGSPVHYLERVGDPHKVVLYFEGGGACFSAATCAFDGPDTSYAPSSDFTADSLAERGGVFDFENPENPFADYSFVYVPYCTGDSHLGSKTTRYADDLIVEHHGYDDGLAALDHLVATYPDVAELVVTGVSAGSIPTPLYAGLAADMLPEARIVTLGDGSGAYPSDPVLNAFIGSLWGTAEAIPDWPETEGITVREWGIPDFYRYAGQHAPDITFARFDFANDDAQSFYAGLVGVAPDDLLGLIDQNEADIASAGVDIASYTAPGTDHTILWRDAFYDVEVQGVRLVDWVAGLIAGDRPADIHCTDCH